MDEFLVVRLEKNRNHGNETRQVLISKSTFHSENPNLEFYKPE